MTASRIALVSGANKGLGLETSRQLAEREITVLMGARDIAKGRQAADHLSAMGLSVDPRWLNYCKFICSANSISSSVGASMLPSS